MRFFEASLVVVLVVIGICVIGGLVSAYFLGSDNPIEEIAEAVIQQETGVDVDLTPTTPERTIQPSL